MSSTAIEVLRPAALIPNEGSAPVRVLPVPWRDPQTVSKEELTRYIGTLERACQENPRSADLRTCLGMAYAMNYEVYKSMDALEAAVQLDEMHFFAQLKLAELFYRLRALPKAEEETLKAVNLAQNGWELSLARKQLQEIRRLIREGSRKPAWTKSLKMPAAAVLAMVLIFSILMVVTK
jgi:tetratricopeptide (TPR) repeat protein